MMVKEYNSSLELEESSVNRKKEAHKEQRRKHHRRHKHRHQRRAEESDEANVEVPRKRRNSDDQTDEEVKRPRVQEDSSSEEEQPQRKRLEVTRHRKELVDRRSGKGPWRRNRQDGDASSSQNENFRQRGERNRRRPREKPQFDPHRPIKQEPTSDEEGKWGRPAGGGHQNSDSKDAKPQDKQKPNFGLSGNLAKDTNTFNGVVIKYSEPPEARKPRIRWRLYVFKGEETLPTLYVHRQSAYLMGRDRKVVDLPIDHPSCSKQHAALQFRVVKSETAEGRKVRKCKPYIIDLESANGTYVNNKRIDPRRYVELFEKDVIKFGYSSREYVLLHEHSKGDVEEEEEGSQ